MTGPENEAIANSTPSFVCIPSGYSSNLWRVFAAIAAGIFRRIADRDAAYGRIRSGAGSCR